MNFFQNLSLKYKLVLLILSVTLLSLMIGFAVNIFREYETLKEKMLNESIMNAKLVSEYCITPLDFGYHDEAEDNLSKLEAIPAVFYACVYDVHGNSFASYSKVDTVNAPPIPDDTSYNMFSGDWLHVFRTIIYNEEKKGTIYLRVSTVELDEGLKKHLTSILIIGLGMMIIAYFLAIGMQRLISKPILTLADITERVSQKADYTIQIERESSDEIGTLYRSFNNMLKQIHTREMERDKAEEEKTRLNGIIENTTDLVSMSTPDASLLYINRAGRSMLGWTAEENVKSKTISQIHPDWAFRIIDEEGIPAAIETGVWQGETAVIGPKENEIPVLQVIISHKSTDGGLKYLSTIMRDISERKHAEKALQESEDSFRRLTENAQDVIYRMSLTDGRYEYISPAALTVFGYTPKEFYESPALIRTIIHPDWQNYFNEEWQKLLAGDMPPFYEYQIVHKSGNVKWLNQRNVLIKGDSGEPITIEGIVTDITERKQAEKILRESENLYRQAIDNADAIAYTRNFASNSFSFIGERIFNFTGYHSEELTEDIWSNLVQECVMRGNCAGLTEDEAIKLNRNGTLNKWHADFRILSKDGKERWFADSSVLLKDEGGNPVGSLGVLQDITERKQVEEVLRESQAFNETLLNTSPDIIYIYDIVDQKNIYINNGITNVLGYSIEDVQAMGENLISQLMHPDDFKVYINDTISRYQEAKDGELIEHEYRMRHKGGTWHWLYFKESIFMRQDDGTPKHIFGVVSDITERKRAEEALQESENRYRHIVESSLSGMHMYELKENNRLVFTGANPAADRILGMDNSIFIGETIEEAFPPLSETEVPEKYKLAAANGDTWSTEQIMYEKGTISGAFEVFAFQTEPNRMVAMFYDITERKKAEEELRHLRSYLSNIIDSMPSVLAGVDADGRVTQWNKTAEQTTGISAETAQGKLLSDVFPHMSSEMEKITESIRTRQIKQEQKRPRTDENGVMFEDITIYPLISNGAQGAVIRIDNVTDKVRMEEMMIQSEKMLSVGGLAAGMAHEINNPLAGMIQTASVMSDRLTNLEIPANIRAAEEAGISMESLRSFMEKRSIINMLGRIRESGSRAAEIVTNMLSFARKSEASFSTRDLVELLDQTLDLAGSDYDLKRKFDFRQLEIIRDYDKDLPAVSCEAGKIQQVLLNILRNSAEAVYGEAYDSRWKKKEKPRLELRLVHEKEKGYVRIEISDNGPGMSEDVRKRIFEPFFTTKPTDRGTGLGLSVSYFIITENHGGEMSVESAPGEGTRFIIRLPVERRKL